MRLQVQVSLVGQVVRNNQVAESAVPELEVVQLEVVDDLLALDAVDHDGLLAVLGLDQVDVVGHDDLDDALLVTLLVHHDVLLRALVQLDALLGCLLERGVLDDVLPGRGTVLRGQVAPHLGPGDLGDLALEVEERLQLLVVQGQPGCLCGCPYLELGRLALLLVGLG